MARLANAMKSFSKNESTIETQIPLKMLQCLNDFVNQEITMFFTALKINGKYQFEIVHEL